MTGLEAFLPAVGNLGGMAVLAWCMFILHRDAIKAFREELTSERVMWSAQLESERVERRGSVQEIKRECQEQHDEVIEQLSRIEVDLRSVRSALEKRERV